MVRTVKVRLELDRDDYKRGLKDAAAETRGFDGEVRAAGKDVGLMGVEVKATGKEVSALGKEVDAAGAKTEKLGDSAKKASQETTKAKESVTGLGTETSKTSLRMQELAREIEQTRTAVGELSGAWRKSRDEDIGPMLRDQQEHLRRLRAEYDKLKDGGGQSRSLFSRILQPSSGDTGGVALFGKFLLPQLAKAGADGGGAFGQGFLAVLKPFAVPAAIAFGIPLVTTLGALLGGVTLGATGLGGLGAALALQFKDPVVHSAVVDLGTFILGHLQAATRNIIDPGAFTAFRREMTPLFADLRSGFEALSPYFTMLLMRLGEGLAKLGPGLSHAMQAAAPILGAIANQLPTLLNGLGIFFEQISHGAKGSAEAITMIIKAISLVIAMTGSAINILAHVFDGLLQGADAVFGVLAKIPGMSAVFGPIHDYVHSVATSFDEANISGSAFGDTLGGPVAAGAADAAGGLERATRAAQDLFGTWMSVDQANISLAESMNALKDSVKQNGTALEGNSASALNNQKALLAVQQGAEAVREADLKAGASADFANSKYERNMQSLYALAASLGFSRDQTDAFLHKYAEIPPSKKVEFVLAGIDGAIERVIGLRSELNSVHDRTVTVTTVHNDVTGENRTTVHPGVPFSRWGGAWEHAAVGKLRDAATYTTANPGRYVIAEPGTGGEAFVPKNGNYGRSMSILSQAASWYGASVMPGRMSGGATALVHNHYDVTVAPVVGASPTEQGAAVVKVIKSFEQSNGKGWRS